MNTKQKCPIKCSTDWFSILNCTLVVYREIVTRLINHEPIPEVMYAEDFRRRRNVY